MTVKNVSRVRRDGYGGRSDDWELRCDIHSLRASQLISAQFPQVSHYPPNKHKRGLLPTSFSLEFQLPKGPSQVSTLPQEFQPRSPLRPHETLQCLSAWLRLASGGWRVISSSGVCVSKSNGEFLLWRWAGRVGWLSTGMGQPRGVRSWSIWVYALQSESPRSHGDT